MTRDDASTRGGVGLLFALALATCAILYLGVVAKALRYSPLALIAQTENWYGLSLNEQFVWGYILYGLLCIALLVASVTIRRRDTIALISLLVALLLMVNDYAGAFYEVALVTPGLPESGPAFERFYNEWHIPDQIWRVFMVIVALAFGWCALGMRKNRRML